MTALLWILVALPAVAGALLLVAGRAADRWGALAGIGTSLVTAGTALLVVGQRPSTEVGWLPLLPVGLGVDDLSAAMVLVVAAVLPLVLVSAWAQRVESPARFHGVMLVFGAAVLLTATATTLAPLLVGWEVMGATSWALIAHRYRSAQARRGGVTAFLTTRAADLGLYAAVGAALAGGVGTRLVDLDRLDGGWLTLATLGIGVAALAKAAQLPFSSWLSGAMHAPSQVSALLHSAAMVAMGGYLLLRIAPLLAASGGGADAVAWTGVLTALALGAVAVAQTDLKQLLAASTAAQLGFVVLAAGVGGVAQGRDELVAHAAVKATLFLAAGALLHALGTKRLRSLTGAGRTLPWVGVPAVVAALALAGLPPLSLWATKENLLSVVRESSTPLYVAALGASVLSAAYAGRIVWVLLATAPAEPAWYDAEEQGTRQVARADGLVLAVLAVAAVALGVVALPLQVDPTGVVLSVAALIVGLVVVVRRPLPPLAPTGVLSDWLHLDQLTHLLVVRPVTDLARLVATVDDRLLVRAVDGVAASTRAVAHAVATVDAHGPDAVVRGVAAGTRALARLAVRPQTGQLHQYYAQAAVALGGAGLLLWIVR